MKLIITGLLCVAVIGSQCVAWANQATKNDKQEKKATDLSKAKATVDAIRPADPPQASTSTKPSPAGQPASDYKPKPKPSKETPPPPPPKKP